jgi:chromosome segregation ATPase
MATLVYSDVDGVDRSFTLGAEPVMVGRGAECAIRSDDPRVSRVHARFFVEQGALWVEDLGSSNGIFVGPNKVSRAPVPTGEIVLVGSLLIRLLPASGTLPPPMGLHATLASWLDVERKTRAVVEDERDAFARRVGEMHHELEAVMSARTMAPDAPELTRQRDEAEARSAAAERALATLQDELALARDQIIELRAEVVERADWSSGETSETAPRIVTEVTRLQGALDEAEHARSIAEHAHGEAMREAQIVRDELVACKTASAAELEAALVELGKLRESNMIAEAAAGVAVAEKLAEADRVASSLQRELAELRGSRGHAQAGLDARLAELTERVAAITARADKAEHDLASAQIRAQGSERNLSGANASAAEAEARAAELEQQVGQAEDRIRTAEARVAELEQELAAAVERAARELGAQLDQAQEELGGRLAQAVRELAAERSTSRSLVDRQTQLEREVAAARSQLPALEQRADAAERKVAEADVQLEALQDRIDDLERGLAVAEAVIAEGREALRAEQAAAGKARSAVAEANEIVEQQRSRLVGLEGRLREADHVCVTAETALREAREQITRLEHAAAERAGLADADRDRLADALARIGDADRQIGALAARAEAADLAIGRAGALQHQLDEALTRLAWLERERLESEVRDARGDTDAMNRRAPAKHEDAALRHQLAADGDLARTGSQLPIGELAEHVIMLEESINSLRANMRAASDETAMMDPSESVSTISTAVSQAAEHVETARAAIRALAASIGMS